MMKYDEHYNWIVKECVSGEGNLLIYNNNDIKNNQLEFLTNHFKQINPASILEVGTNCSCFAYYIHHILPKAKLITLGIDEWSEKFVHYLNNVYGSYINFVLGDSRVTLKEISATIDLAWIDGCHTPDCLMSDLVECVRLNIEHIFIDDYEYRPISDTVENFLQKYTSYFIKDKTNNNTRDIVYIKRL